MSTLFGYEGYLAYKVGGQSGGGSWVEATNVQDLTDNNEADDVDVTTRATGGFKVRVSGLKDYQVQFKSLWDTDDPFFAALLDAFYGADEADKLIGLQILDEEGGTGIQADFNIFTFERNQDIAGAQTVSVTAKIARSADAPEVIGG